MRIMTGLIKPTSGEVRIDSYNVQTQRQQAISRVGGIIESPIFFEYMTGRQVLRNLSRLHPTIKSSQREEQIEKLLTTVGLEKEERIKYEHTL